MPYVGGFADKPELSRLQGVRDLVQRNEEKTRECRWRDRYDPLYRQYRLALYTYMADFRKYRGQEPDSRLEELIAQMQLPTPPPPPGERGRYRLYSQQDLDEGLAARWVADQDVSRNTRNPLCG